MSTQSVCETVPNRAFSIIVANGPNDSVALSKKMLMVLCTPASDIFWLKLYEDDKITMNQLLKGAEATKRKLKRYFAVEQIDAARSEKH